MEPIINPWIIYLLEISMAVKGVLIGFAIASGIGLVVYLICLYIKGTDDENSWHVLEKSLVHARSKLKIFRWIFPMCLFFAVVVPTRNTIIGMLIAKNITSVNVEKAVKTGSDFKNEIKRDILDIIQSIRDNKFERKQKSEKK